MQLKRTGIVLSPNKRRVVLRPFQPEGDDRILRLIGRVSMLTEAEVNALLDQVMSEFHGRHRRPKDFFEGRFRAMRGHLLTDTPLTPSRRLLMGAYFTQEYALESAALFNPSLVRHPDQSGLPELTTQFVLSVRAVGEGHISSITFRTVTIDQDLKIVVDEPAKFVTTPEFVPDSSYEKSLFRRKMIELELGGPFIDEAFSRLDHDFTLEQLEHSLQTILRDHRMHHNELAPLVQQVVMLAKSNYEIQYTPDQVLSERLIFPFGPTETNGIEDARFVQFQDDDGSLRYYATYSAYDGKMVLPQLLETKDFLRFKMHTLNGPAIENKGMALFPRKINGHYAMLSRQDGEHLFLMYSDMLYFWHHKEIVLRPTNPWEFVQMGNCGPPIETDKGWLVLTHGVGPMRKYTIGAILLDLDDPSRVIGRLQEPLLTPNENEREGYVPNVVYSCGAVIHNGHLILPYAMSDYASSFATVAIDELLDALLSQSRSASAIK
ncbi:glycoside hydrolase family 130 protein [Novipirellula artificiosorum]|uniref:Beta-1,4-mannooligosaccharide phosphorylase n=1 Tax=Novipirellula artificiosorum TaxID=2528016 RepID=A0A5C6D3L0_9BACT|nr:glycoside hydrolase family 130 protein [Novipirellula artificiosorum]TWU31390.1 Beta-1,4-mannooligosaccharide phosphorylase [Novipirellula artificiosorum]